MDEHLLCPACGSFVRSDWTERCGSCGTMLTESDGATAVPDAARSAPRAPTAMSPFRKAARILAAVAVLTILGRFASFHVQDQARQRHEASQRAVTVDATTLATQLRSQLHLLGAGAQAGLIDGKALAAQDWQHVRDATCACAADFPSPPVASDNQLVSQDHGWVLAVLSFPRTVLPGDDVGTALDELLGTARVGELVHASEFGSEIATGTSRTNGTTMTATLRSHGGSLFLVATIAGGTTDPAPVFDRFAASFAQLS